MYKVYTGNSIILPHVKKYKHKPFH